MRSDKIDAPVSNIAPNQADGVKLERQGQLRWLSVNLPPEQIWDQVRTFWTEVGFELTTDKSDIGVMETNWSENKAKVAQDGVIRNALGRVFDALYDTGERDMYRTRIERTAKGSEIYISHRGLSEEYEDSKKDHTVWRGRPSDPTLEAEMLSRLMAKLGAPKDAVAAVKNDKAPVAAPTSSLARLNTDGLSMTVDADFDTAWRRVGLALDRSGFTVENRDRKLGTYEVRLSDNDPDAGKPGFFARMFGAKTTDGLSRYRVVVQNQGKSSLVSVTDEKGQATSSSTAKRITKQLLDELG
jgi:outer membrane protein assembly factor BamC